MKTLVHLGCGRKKLDAATLLEGCGFAAREPYQVVHLDQDARLAPDVVCTLGVDPLPFSENSVDVLLAWHVLEHVGRQGEAAAWFQCFEEAYRVLVPGGLFLIGCPYYTGIWAWSDPTHTRAISEHSFVFFSQDAYRVPGSMISPYRLRCDLPITPIPGLPKGWDLTTNRDPKDVMIRVALTARKPFVPWWEDPS